jgi:hypothetical protein
MQDNDIDKYKPVEGQHEAQNFGEENLKKFVDDFLAGNVPQHYLTEKLPEDWNKTPVKVCFNCFLSVCLSVFMVFLFLSLSLCFMIFWPVMFPNIISPKSCRKIGTRLPFR